MRGFFFACVFCARPGLRLTPGVLPALPLRSGRVEGAPLRGYGRRTSRPAGDAPGAPPVLFWTPFGPAMNRNRLNEPITPAILVSRLDCERIEALLESPAAEHHDTAALRAELERADIVEPAQMPPDVITMNS